jgi:hypothetical protein
MTGARKDFNVMWPLILALLAGLGGCERMPIEVELEIFSGRPNPTWVLEKSLQAECVSRLKAMRPALDSAFPPPQGLGYRGFIVRVPKGLDCSGETLVYRGIAERGGRRYEDPDRRFEKWLLETGGSAIQDELKLVVKRELQ